MSDPCMLSFGLERLALMASDRSDRPRLSIGVVRNGIEQVPNVMVWVEGARDVLTGTEPRLLPWQPSLLAVRLLSDDCGRSPRRLPRTHYPYKS